MVGCLCSCVCCGALCSTLLCYGTFVVVSVDKQACRHVIPGLECCWVLLFAGLVLCGRGISAFPWDGEWAIVWVCSSCQRRSVGGQLQPASWWLVRTALHQAHSIHTLFTTNCQARPCICLHPSFNQWCSTYPLIHSEKEKEKEKRGVESFMKQFTRIMGNHILLLSLSHFTIIKLN